MTNEEIRMKDIINMLKEKLEETKWFLDVEKSFHKVAVSERDYERVRFDRVERERNERFTLDEIKRVMTDIEDGYTCMECIGPSWQDLKAKLLKLRGN